MHIRVLDSTLWIDIVVYSHVLRWRLISSVSWIQVFDHTVRVAWGQPVITQEVPRVIGLQVMYRHLVQVPVGTPIEKNIHFYLFIYSLKPP